MKKQNDCPSFLSDEFLSNYPTHPEHMSPLGLFTFYRTYSRFIPSEKRRETWKETCARAVQYNISLEYFHRIKTGLPVNEKLLRNEAESLFDSMFNLRQFVSGRSLWISGTKVTDDYPMANFNCSFTNIEQWEDLSELFYLLMLGSGVGFKSTPEMAKNMPPIRTNTNLILSEYNPLPVDYRLENTDVRYLENGFAKIYVGDSKEGWRDALMAYLDLLTKPEHEHIHTIKISFNSVRPKGERLKIFGGTASGPEPLREMFHGFDAVLKNAIDPSLAPIEVDSKGYGKVRPIHVLDMGNLIGANVVSGGVRRTAEIFLFDASDYETLFAKYAINGFWSEEHFKQHEKVKEHLVSLGVPVPGWFDSVGERNYSNAVNGSAPYNYGRSNIGHRRLSNNSIMFQEKPYESFLHLVFQMIQLDGEPGFINHEEMNRRRENAHGVNPCFTGDMHLLTPHGYKRFSDLDGNTIPIINADGNIVDASVWCSGEKEIWKMTLHSRYALTTDIYRQVISATANHVFMTYDGEEVELQNAKGKKLRAFGHGSPEWWDVVSVENTGEIKKVYDFTEPETHWGIVEGVVAHNCGEILLDNKQQCNLTTVNLKGFVSDDGFDLEGASNAQALSARAGVRMTLVDLEIPRWNEIHKRDRLVGCSMTGVQDAIGTFDIDRQKYILEALSVQANRTAEKYAKELRIPSPLLVTTLKPEGSLSLVAGGVSPGIHDAHSPYFIRRIRISSDDALAKAALVHGWQIHPEVGTPDGKIENARTLVIDFPIKSGATKTKDDVSALQQLERYLMFQRTYTNHNSSNTITVRPDEWEGLEKAIIDEWDEFVGVSFLSLDGGTYMLAPYESITKEEYEDLLKKFMPFDPKILQFYESIGVSDLDESDPDCATGGCPLR